MNKKKAKKMARKLLAKVVLGIDVPGIPETFRKKDALKIIRCAKELLGEL